MGAIGPLQLVLIAIVALLLFGGRGRISSIMGDMAKGIRSFRTGLKDESDDEQQWSTLRPTRRSRSRLTRSCGGA